MGIAIGCSKRVAAVILAGATRIPSVKADEVIQIKRTETSLSSVFESTYV